MSTYPFWLLSFELREDLPTQVLEVLCAVGRGDVPDPADLACLPPVVRHYLQDPGRMQSDQGQAVCGTPVRIAPSAWGGPLTMTIEFSQHDDEFANGGWLFWSWVLSLARRPGPGEGGRVLGYHGLYRGDSASHLMLLYEAGVTEDGRLLPFADLDSALAEEIDRGPADIG